MEFDFRPAPGLSNPHAQTLAGKVLRPSPPLVLRTERIGTPDGDFVDIERVARPGGDILDIERVATASDRIIGRMSPTTEAESRRERGKGAGDTGTEAPLRVLVLHGLEGSARRRYMLTIYAALMEAGVHPVGLHFRGCSGVPNLVPRSYHSGETGDLRMVVERLVAESGRPIGLVGFSLGGNVLLKYLGEEGDRARDRVFGAAAVSVPFDLSAAADRISAGVMGRGYTGYFLQSLRRKVTEKRKILDRDFDTAAILAARSLREFDDLATAPIHGFESAADYYAQSSSSRFVPDIRVPTLVVHALDDPFLPQACVPVAALEANPVVTAVLPERGGHLGFVAGGLAHPDFWMERQVGRWFAGLVSEQVRPPNLPEPGP